MLLHPAKRSGDSLSPHEWLPGRGVGGGDSKNRELWLAKAASITQTGENRWTCAHIHTGMLNYL